MNDLKERLALLITKAGSLPWSIRPQEYDDWGMIRSSDKTEFGTFEHVARAHAYVSSIGMAVHRVEKTDPYQDNANLIVEGLNALPALIQENTALEAKCKRLEAALENIQAESERENSRPVHLKRVVDINTRTALNESQDHE